MFSHECHAYPLEVLLSGSTRRLFRTGGVRVLGVAGLGIGDGVDRGALGDGRRVEGEGVPSLGSGVKLIRFLERGDGDFVGGDREDTCGSILRDFRSWGSRLLANGRLGQERDKNLGEEMQEGDL